MSNFKMISYMFQKIANQAAIADILTTMYLGTPGATEEGFKKEFDAHVVKYKKSRLGTTRKVLEARDTRWG